jgi:hypothetical protein
MPLNTLSNYNQTNLPNSNLYTSKFSFVPSTQSSTIPDYSDYVYHQPPNQFQLQLQQQSQHVRMTPTTSLHSNHLTSSHSPISIFNASNESSSFSLNSTTPPLNQSLLYNLNKANFIPVNSNENEKYELHSNLKERSFSSNSSKISKIPIKSSKTNLKSKKSSSSENISLNVYEPADPNVDLSQFTEEDIIILKNILSLAEIHKWKHISNRISKSRSRKLSSEYCINKFHSMYGLPFNAKNSLLHSNYFLKLNKDQHQKDENFEGMLGSSIPYIVSKDGWNLIDP